MALSTLGGEIVADTAEVAQAMAVWDKAPRIDEVDRQRGLSMGLVLFCSSGLAGLLG
jgi:hypothetical protein